MEPVQLLVPMLVLYIVNIFININNDEYIIQCLPRYSHRTYYSSHFFICLMEQDRIPMCCDRNVFCWGWSGCANRHRLISEMPEILDILPKLELKSTDFILVQFCKVFSTYAHLICHILISTLFEITILTSGIGNTHISSTKFPLALMKPVKVIVKRPITQNVSTTCPTNKK